MSMFNDLPFGSPFSLALAPVSLVGGPRVTTLARVRDVNEFMFLWFILGVGTAAEEVTVTLTQATDSADAGNKALVVKEAWYKRGGPTFTAANAAARDSFVKSTLMTREVPAATYVTTTDRVAATNLFMGLIRISPKDVDHANGFKYVKASFNSVTNAQLVSALWIPHGLAHSGTTAPSILG